MGKKNKNKFRGGLDTLSRLATTVKADAPTLLLGNKSTPSGTVKNEGYASPFGATPEAKPKSRLSQLWQDRKAAKKLKKLAKQMASQGNHNMIKIRRSRLPFVIALLVVALGFGGYYMFRSVTLPQVKVSNVVDYKDWLSKTSGEAPKAKPQPKVVRSYKISKKGNHVSKSLSKKSKKSSKKAKLGKAKGKKSSKAKLAKGKRGKGKVKRTSHKR